VEDMYNNKNTKLINLCIHPVNIMTEEGMVTIPPSGLIARCIRHNSIVGYVNGIPLTKEVIRGVVGLPDAEDGKMFIVSKMIKDYFPYRTDLVRVGPKVTSVNGKPVACTSLNVS
jgi:hypothetical protein